MTLDDFRNIVVNCPYKYEVLSERSGVCLTSIKRALHGQAKNVRIALSNMTMVVEAIGLLDEEHDSQDVACSKGRPRKIYEK